MSENNLFTLGLITGFIFTFFLMSIVWFAVGDIEQHKNKFEKVCIWYNGIPYYLESEKNMSALIGIPNNQLMKPN